MSENYIIIGDDGYIRDQGIEKIKKQYLQEGDEALSYSVHEPPEYSGFLDSIATMPFISDKRVVVLKKAEEMPAELIESLEKYLEGPLDSTILVLSAGGSFEKSKPYKKIAGYLQKISADKPTPLSMRKKIRSFFSGKNVVIDDHAVNLIVELKGDDTAGIKMELEKLLAFSDGNSVSVDDVEALVGRSVTETVFKLVDAINYGDMKKAYLILNDMYDQKKPPPEIIGYLGWYVKILKSIKYYSRRGMSPDAIARELGRSAGHIKRLASQAKLWDDRKLDRWTKTLFSTDRDIKRGYKNQLLAMDMMISQIGSIK